MKYSPFFAAGSVGASSDSTFEMGWVNVAYSTAVPTSTDQNGILLSGYIDELNLSIPGANFVMNAEVLVE